MTRIQAGEGVRFPHLRTPKGSPRERGSEGTRGCHLGIREYLEECIAQQRYLLRNGGTPQMVYT
jgi:hypothetical protein